MLKRLLTRCLLRPGDVSPSRPDMRVVGVFNPGAVELQAPSGASHGPVVLMVRVAERPIDSRPGYTALPRYEPGQGIASGQPTDLAIRVPQRPDRLVGPGWLNDGRRS